MQRRTKRTSPRPIPSNSSAALPPPSHLLLPNDVRAPLPPGPDLVDAPGLDVDPVANAMPRRRLPGPRVPGIRDGQLAAQDDVRRRARVGVRAVVCVPGGGGAGKVVSWGEGLW